MSGGPASYEGLRNDPEATETIMTAKPNLWKLVPTFVASTVITAALLGAPIKQPDVRLGAAADGERTTVIAQYVPCPNGKCPR